MASRLQDIIRRGTRAAQPVASSVGSGTLYYVTDELKTERASDTATGYGGSWETYNDTAIAAAGALTKLDEQSPTGTFVTLTPTGAFTHLLIVYNARGDTAATSISLQVTFNGDNGANYDAERVNFTNAATFATQVAANFIQTGNITAATGPASYASGGTVYIHDYRAVTFFKSLQQVQAGHITALSAGNIPTAMSSGWWRSTAAITSITFTLAAGNFVAGSKFSLYGIS